MAGVKRSLATMMAGERSPSLATRHDEPSSTCRSQNSSANSSDDPSRAPSPGLPYFNGQMPKFTADASIVMVGVRATGKTTLAIMAASALKKKIIDMEASFQRAANLSSHAYRKIHGTAQCQRRQGHVLENVLQNNPRDSIILCSWMERRVQGLLRQFATTNPVVHVMRSQEAIRDCLRIVCETKLHTFWRTSNAFFRTCSNLEFFNVSEAVATEPEQTTNGVSAPGGLPPYLALKQAERHLLKFLSQIYPPGTIPFFESAYPLASVPTEHRSYTYALSVSLGDILDGRVDIEDASAGADAVQILVDGIAVEWNNNLNYMDEYTRMANRITEAVGLVRRISVLPIIIHVPLPDPPSETTTFFYLDLLSHALSLLPDMMTIDLRLDDSAISKLSTLKRGSKLIAKYSASSATSFSDHSDWIARYQRAVQLECDLVRLTRPASSVEDNFDVARLRSALEALPGHHIPITAYNSGPLGRHSAFLNPVLTPVSPPRSGSSDSASQAPSQLTAQSATGALYASFLFDPMKLYVFGANVGYSMSPAMHNAALEACGIPHRYEPRSTNSLNQVKHLIQDCNFGGASIGLPFKVEFITLTDSLSPHAQAIGAINTLIPIRKLKEDGSVPTGADFFRGVSRAGPVKALYGENTDWIGIRACIRRGLSPANAVRPATCALIIGAGGMARAAVYALLQVGVSNIAIYNRTLNNGHKLAEHFRLLLNKAEFQGLGAGKNTKFEVLTELSESWQSQFRLPSIAISCIPTHPIGDAPSPEFKLPTSWLANQTGGVIVELGYKNLNTPLLRQATENASRGWIAMDGLDLLPDQGFAQFELFTGRRAPRRVMRRAIFENYPDQYGRSNPEELRRRLQTMTE